MKKYFIFSDTHGEFAALIEGLNNAGFDSKNPNHILFSAGDLFDRGTENIKIYEFLKPFIEQDRLFMVLGNHDEMLLDVVENRLEGYLFNVEHNGLFQTIQEFARVPISDYLYQWKYRGLDAHLRINTYYPELKNFLRKMVRGGFVLDDYVITHGGFDFNILHRTWTAQCWTNTEKFVNQIQNFETRFKFVFGHWHAYLLRARFQNVKTTTSEPFIYKNFIGLDAISNFFFKVNVFVIETDSIPQSFNSNISLYELENYLLLKEIGERNKQ